MHQGSQDPLGRFGRAIDAAEEVRANGAVLREGAARSSPERFAAGVRIALGGPRPPPPHPSVRERVDDEGRQNALAGAGRAVDPEHILAIGPVRPLPESGEVIDPLTRVGADRWAARWLSRAPFCSAPNGPSWCRRLSRLMLGPSEPLDPVVEPRRDGRVGTLERVLQIADKVVVVVVSRAVLVVTNLFISRWLTSMLREAA